MSCIYLDKNHYQFVADQLNQACRKFNRLMPFYSTKKEFDAHTCDESEHKILLFIKMLQTWNATAYCERYPKELADQDPIDFVKKINCLEKFEPYQFLKALECIDYQCSDSEKYSESNTRKILKTIIDDCKNYIIGESNEYQSAKWGIA